MFLEDRTPHEPADSELTTGGMVGSLNGGFHVGL